MLDGLPQDIEISDQYKDWQVQSMYLKSHLISYIIERCERFNRNLAPHNRGSFSLDDKVIQGSFYSKNTFVYDQL